MAEDKKLYHLVSYLVKTINLPDFIESATTCDLTWSKNNQSVLCNCPMPNHNDKNASFRINLMDDAWIFHCFGCHVKGNIVHFCMHYYGLRNKYESILFLCKKLNIKNKEDIIIQSIKNVSKRVDLQRKMENANVMVSNQCRMLLRKDFNLHKEWVSQSYKKLDVALDSEDYDAIESLGYEASNRIVGKVAEVQNA